MKLAKKMTALLAVCAIVAVSMVACGTSSNDEIVAENANTKVSLGAYAYNMVEAYSYARNLVPNVTATTILDQKIEDKPVAEWMKDYALNSVKNLMFIDAKAKELGVTLTDAERKEIDDNMNSQWNTSQENIKQLISFGVTKEGAKQTVFEKTAKTRAIFNAIYGENGTKAVSADEKKAYLVDNYSDFSYVQKDIANLSDEEKATAKAALEAYAASINDKSKTIEQVAEEYKTTNNLTTDPLKKDTVDFAQSSKYQESMKTALNEMQPGEARVVETSITTTSSSSVAYVLVVKNDINTAADTMLADADTNLQVLYIMKNQEFLENLNAEYENFTDFTIHEDVIAKFDPSVFETPQDTSSTESTPASSATSQAANDTTSSETTTSN